jgi:hypothetical protein
MNNMPSAVATSGVTTAAVLLGLDILSHNHVHLSENDVGYVRLLANAFSHTVCPYIRAVANKLTAVKAEPPVKVEPRVAPLARA